MSDRHVLIAGARGGLGTAIVARLLRGGRSVLACDRRDEDLEAWGSALETEVGETGGCLRVATLNAADEADVEDLARALARDGVTVGALVNAIGLQYPSPVSDLDTKRWQLVQDVNVLSSFLLTRAFVPGMVEAHSGRIVLFGSVFGYEPGPNQCAYASAKAAIGGLTRSLAVDVARHGITVNAISPGLIWHEGLRGLWPDEDFAALIQKIPSREPGNPDDISGVVEFLLSRAARYITGSTIHVNGGMYMAP